jgi:hypothetical protein
VDAAPTSSAVTDTPAVCVDGPVTHDPTVGPSSLILSLPTPVLRHRLAASLVGHAKVKRDRLLQGFSFGFRIPSTFTGTTRTHFPLNHLSALQHRAFVTAKLAQEAAAGRNAGPFHSPSPPGVMLPPLGVVDKKVPGQFRLIHDLSFHKGDSVNSHIAKLHSEVHYELLDDCVTIIREIGPGCLVAKADIKDAFRIIPTHPADHRILGMSWQGQFYYDRCLPMGCSTSCRTFEHFHRPFSGSLRLSFVFHICHIFWMTLFFSVPPPHHCL